MRWLTSLSFPIKLLLGGGLVLACLLIARLVIAHQIPAAMDAAQWEKLRGWASTVYRVEASTANCHLPEGMGPFRMAEAEARLQMREDGITADQKEALASIARAEQDIGNGMALGMTRERCEQSLHLLDGAIREMTSAD
jgi:hypothetical protein